MRLRLLGDTINCEPTVIEVTYLGKRTPITMPIADPRGSVLATDIVCGYLEHAYGRDFHHEVWPIVKGDCI